jgi:hypothetical protein
MSEITFSKASIPIWNGADGSVDVDVNVSDPLKPIDPAAGNPIVKASFDIQGGNNATFGSDSTLKLGFDASTSLLLAPIWHNQVGAATDLDKEFGISTGLDNQTVALALDVGGKADLSAAGSFHYSALAIGATVNAGADARFVCVRPYANTESLAEILDNFFSNLALPGTLLVAPAKGALYSLELGGYLKLGVNASAGYSIKGTKALDFANLKLSESYDLSILGKLGVTAQIAGRFSVQIRAGTEDGWANVQVFRKRTDDIQFAADLNVTASSKLQGLPTSGKEFLGALLGVNAKNWINLVDSVATQAGAITSVADLEKSLDGLATTYISRYANKAIAQIVDNTPEATALLGRLTNVVNSYRNFDSSAIALFDRYFDVVTGKADQLVAALGKISALQSLKDFEGEIDPVVWNVFQQLTNGDPLTAILQDPIAAITKKVNDTLSLISADAHSDIRDFIALAKSQFGLDPLMNEIAKFDSVATLQQQATDEAQHLVQRLTGTVFNKIPTHDLQAVLDLAKKISDGTAAFWKAFDSALTQAASQSFSLELNAVCDRSDENTALIDVDINMQDFRGRAFLKEAGIGDFSDILANYNPQLVRLNKGALTHNLQSSQGVTINIVGWHLNFQYESSFKVLTQSDQQIRPSANGRLNVFTTIDMQAQKNTRRKTTKAEETMHTNFTLRLLAEANDIVDGSRFDKENHDYLIDVVTGAAAFYEMSFTDSNTTPQKLDEALDFARVLGLDKVGANVPALQPVLQIVNGSYGDVAADYRVVFTPAGLEGLFSQKFDAVVIRSILKPIVLANYYREPVLSVVGWMYVNDTVKAVWEDKGPNFVNAGSVLGEALPDLRPESPIPGIAPQLNVDTSSDITFRFLTSTLYSIEADLADAFAKLQALVGTKREITDDELTKAVNNFGGILNEFDKQSLGDNTTFAVMDGLIQRANPGRETRSSALDLTTHTGGAERHTVFQLQPK